MVGGTAVVVVGCGSAVAAVQVVGGGAVVDAVSLFVGSLAAACQSEGGYQLDVYEDLSGQKTAHMFGSVP